MRLLIGLTVSLQAISLARSNMSQVNAINVDLGIRRAIDVALAEARPGDGIYLLRKRSRPDDDKRGFSAQLARISPWKTLPRVRPYPFPYQDHRHGQPRALKDLTIYVNDRPREVLLDAASATRGSSWWSATTKAIPATKAD